MGNKTPKQILCSLEMAMDLIATAKGGGDGYVVNHLDAADNWILEVHDFLTALVNAGAPTQEAYLSVCRALNWRNAQLRASGLEPLQLTTEMPHYPPEDYTFPALIPDDKHWHDFYTHRAAWTQAIVYARAYKTDADGTMDAEGYDANYTYWSHELEAFNRLFDTIPALQTNRPDTGLLAALNKIGGYQRGGIVITGTVTGDRDEMIGIARAAVRDYTIK